MKQRAWCMVSRVVRGRSLFRGAEGAAHREMRRTATIKNEGCADLGQTCSFLFEWPALRDTLTDVRPATGFELQFQPNCPLS